MNAAPITVGIIGLGRAGWNLHMEPMLQMPGFKIVAVADPIEERCREAAKLAGCKMFSCTEDLLSGSSAELVVVASPSLSHYADAALALAAGRHCICEKPMALDTDAAFALVAAARERGLGLFVHHTYLHRPQFHHMRSVLDSGALGTLFSARVCWAGFNRRWDWQTLRKNGGGQMNNIGSHVLSILLPLLGSRVSEVFADLRNVKDAGDAEDHVEAFLRTENGVTATIAVSTAMALSGPRWSLCGTRGAFLSDEVTSTIKTFEPGALVDVAVIDAAAPGRQYMTETIPWREISLQVPPAPVAGFHQNVLECLGSAGAPIVTPESAAEVVRVTNMVLAFRK